MFSASEMWGDRACGWEWVEPPTPPVHYYKRFLRKALSSQSASVNVATFHTGNIVMMLRLSCLKCCKRWAGTPTEQSLNVRHFKVATANISEFAAALISRQYRTVCVTHFFQ